LDDDEDEGNGQNDGLSNVAASHVIALVDCHPDMFKHIDSFSGSSQATDTSSPTPKSKIGEPKTPFDGSLFILEVLMQHTIEDTVILKTGKQNGVGVILYNTKPIRPTNPVGNHESHLNDYDHDDDDDDDDDEEEENDGDKKDVEEEDVPPQWMVHELMALEPPGIKNVQTIQNFQRRKNDRNLQDEFCPSSAEAKAQRESSMTPLQSAIETSMRMFQSADCVRDPKKVSSSTKSKGKSTTAKDNCSIWIFTNRESPYTNPKGVELVANVAKEAAGDMGIDIVVWPLPIDDGVVSNKSNVQHGDDEGDDKNKVPFNSEFYKSLLLDEEEPRFDSRFADHKTMEDSLVELEIATKRNRKMYTTPLHILKERNVSENVDDDNDDDEADNDDMTRTPKTVSQPPMMVDWYAITRECKRPSKHKIDSETKLKVKRTRIWTLKDSDVEIARFSGSNTVEERQRQQAMPVKKLVRKFYQFVNEPVRMELSETQQMKTMGCRLKNPGLIIMGFKPIESIPSYHRVKHSFLIYPTDDDVEGSTTAFARLHSAMIRKNVLAVGQYWLRQSWEWRYCAIRPLPSSSEGRLNGIVVVPLPFRDDLRSVEPDAASRELDAQQDNGCTTMLPTAPGSAFAPSPTASPTMDPTTYIKQELSITDDAGTMITGDDDDGTKGNIAPEELVNAAMNLMSKMDLTEEGIVLGDSLLENPAMLDFYDYLSCIAFGLPRSKIENHLLRPTDEDKKKLKFKVKAEVDDFLAKLPVNAEKPKGSRKRMKDLVPDSSGLDWDDLLQTGEISTCKIDQLKSYLRSVGETLSGRKDELVSRVTSHLLSRQQQETMTPKKMKIEEDDAIKMEV
jgi:Ku70/Ku80 beta-barrel domain